MRAYYIEFEKKMYLVEKNYKHTNIFLEKKLIHNTPEDLPDDKIKKILYTKQK